MMPTKKFCQNRLDIFCYICDKYILFPRRNPVTTLIKQINLPCLYNLVTGKKLELLSCCASHAMNACVNVALVRRLVILKFEI